MPADLILRVAVPAPLRRVLDYLPPADDAGPACVGMRVVVPLGPRRIIGIITEIVPCSGIPDGKLRRVLGLPDSAPLLPPDVLELCLFASRYYHAPPGEALVNTLPAELRSPPRARKPAPRLLWHAHAAAAALPADALTRAPKQAAALAALTDSPGMSADACRDAGIDAATLRALGRKGLVYSTGANAGSAPARAAEGLPEVLPPPVLNPEQAAAVCALEPSLGRFQCTLLEGVTGSGKTEVYLRFIEQVLAAGRQALVLVPEIGLTPQTRQRFAARFGALVGVLHSGLGDRERLHTWQEAAAGRLRVLIGTRSALFSPLPELGAIIVDEEHDTSYKQQEGFRYSARDLAIFRGNQRGIPVLLGSATPSTESLANCASGRYQHLLLPHRAGNASPPRMRLLDMRGKPLDGGLGQELIEAIGVQLQAGNQVLVFLNRRGWAPVLSCGDCGWMAECQRCDARLTLHRAERLLWCHHCDARRPAPQQCPGCRSTKLVALGAGTERSEHTLLRCFPDFPIHRIDRGTMQGRGALEALLDELGNGEPCILVGTQMLAKGHHFPAVTLAAIVDLDGGLFSSDIRAAERTGQLLIQVAGRAGRAERPGEVLIQTLHPTHPWLDRLVTGGYRAFIDPLLAERQLRGLPPFSHLAVVRLESPREQDALAALSALKREVRDAHPLIDIVGPVPAPLARRAGRYRLQLLLNHPQRAPLHAALEHACRVLDGARGSAHDRWHIDVDPVEGV
jgi:primosomal protein N' (replication factor Y)